MIGVDVWAELVDALSFSFGMFWEILWALILGFALSGVVQAVVTKKEMRRLMPDDSPRSLARATGLGAASSSCSYAAVALARSLFRRGADFTSAIAFEIASTNLVFELGIVIALLLGWEFVVGEFVGGPLMIILVAVAFRIWLKRRLVEEAREQANKGLVGSMEGHAEMDMSASGEGTWWQRLRTPRGFTATSDYFVMDWAAIYKDIGIGLLVAGALAAWVPRLLVAIALPGRPPDRGEVLGADRRAARRGDQLRLLGREHPARRRALERRDQLRRRDRLHLRRPDHRPDPQHQQEVLRPPKMAGVPARSCYGAMVLAGLGVELALRRDRDRADRAEREGDRREVTWNYTTYLNIVFLALAAVLVWRYFRRGGGLAMLR